MKNNHLSLEDRKEIQKGLEEGLSRTNIAERVKKDPSTIGKEVKLRRKLKHRNTFNTPILCANLRKCKKCNGRCSNYVEPKCIRRDRKVGVCNLCPKTNNCRLDKYFYHANQAHKEYLYTLSDAREGVNLTSKEMFEIANIIKPLLKQGQSVYQIIENHPEINLCVKSLYMYIESGVFKEKGINNFSLIRQVNMRQRKKLKKRKEPVNYEGRKYKDYLVFIEENPTIPTTEMDTIYSNPEGPYIQTFIFENTGLMIGFLHQEKTSSSMSGTLNHLQEILEEDYCKLFSLLLTDRGNEFEKYTLFEINTETGEIRSNIFYCDPQTPSQKPHVENTHNFVRRILQRKKSLKGITQIDIELMFSHINSTPRESLNGKTPYETFAFLYGEEILEKLNVQQIAKDMVTLKPYLLNIK